MSIKIALADDHAVIRDGIKAIIERKEKDMQVIGEASNGKELLAIAQNTPADIYIIDISMPVLNGIETIKQLMQIQPNCKTIVLSMYDDRSLVEQVLQSGAKGYVLKENAIDEVLQAIKEVSMDRFFLSSQVSQFVVEGFLGQQTGAGKKSKEKSVITKREKEVLKHIAQGLTSKDISQELNLSLHTIHAHRKNIMRKLNIHKQAELIRYALKEGLTQL